MRPIEPLNSTSPTSASFDSGVVEDDVARGVAGAVADVEGQLADGRGVAVDQPAVGLERLADDAVARAILGEAVDPEAVVLVRALDRHAELGGEDPGRAAMVDMAVGEEDLLDRHAVLGDRGLEPVDVAAGIDERAAHRLRCTTAGCNSAASGVTGMIVA